MQSYLNSLKQIMDEGEIVATGAFLANEQRQPTARTLLAAQFRHDLRAGFPAVTTKKLYFDSVVKEILWFLRGETNVKTLGCGIWNQWAGKNGMADGECGRIYGYQWRRQKHITEIEPKRHTVQPPQEPPFFAYETADATQNANDLVGTIGSNTSGHQYRVLREYKDDDPRRGHVYDVQFLGTGYVARGIRRDMIRGSGCADRYALSSRGAGRIGEPVSVPHCGRLLDTWANMMDRCYNPKCKEYLYYGAKGTVVDGPWHIFSTFAADVQQLEGWDDFATEPEIYQLDKDYLGGKCYSKETCLWLHKDLQKVYRSNWRPFVATSPEGGVVRAVSATAFANEFGLDRPKVSACIRGERASHKGWTFKALPTDRLYREVVVDQIGDIVRDLRAVAADPSNRARRRIILTGWNPPDIPLMGLPPCHTLAQFIPTNGVLHCHCFWRSIDAPVGMPFNIAQYALLTHLFAAVTGLEVGNLVASITDLHIYDNQIGMVLEQLRRQPYPHPRLVLDAAIPRLAPDLAIDQIRRLEPAMFTLADYQCHPPLRCEVAV